jgi:hypothetical protein
MHSAGCCCPGCYSLVDYLQANGEETHGLLASPPTPHDHRLVTDIVVKGTLDHGGPIAGFKVLAEVRRSSRHRHLAVARHNMSRRAAGPTCHGYANGCDCDTCTRRAMLVEAAREAGLSVSPVHGLPVRPQPLQPWDPKPSRHDTAGKRAA